MAAAEPLNPLLAELKPDELLLWTGQPNPEVYSTFGIRSDKRFLFCCALFSWIFGLVCWATYGFGMRTTILFVVGCLFLFISCIWPRSRFVPYWWYAVTDQRVISDCPTEDAERFTRLPLARLNKISLDRHSDGVGTIHMKFSLAGQNLMSFACIDDAENVYKILENARAVLLSELAMQNKITTPFRPVDAHELRLIADSGYRAFPPRLVDQPIFYPVMNFEYAEQIARAWNTKRNSFAGFVTKFDVDADYLQQFPVQIVGGRQHTELWVPAEKMEEFNSHIIGQIAVVASYYGEQFAGEIDPQTNLPVGL